MLKMCLKFFGMTGYYRKFIINYSDIEKLLAQF